MNRLRFGLGLVLALSFGGWTLISDRQPSAIEPTAVAVRAASLQLGAKFGPSFAGEMVAARAGLFDQEGVVLDLSSGSADIDPIQLVASGAKTIGITSATKFALARARGASIVAFAAGYLESPVVLYTLKSSGLRTPED